jgi:hypothetical protein
VYCAANIGLFVFDISDNEVNVLNTTDGFYELNISTMAYHSASKTLVLAYNSGAIDLAKLDNNGEILEISNLLGIKNSKTILNSKATNSIDFLGEIGYLSTDFGIVQIDLNKRLIKEVDLNLSPSGEPTAVFGTSIIDQKIFAITESKLIFANITSNLQNFNEWKFVDAPKNIRNTGHSLISYQNELFLIFSGSGLFKYSGSSLLKLVDFYDENSKVAIKENSIIFGIKNKLYNYNVDAKKSSTTTLQNIGIPKNIIVSGSVIWIADNTFGLVSDVSGSFKNYNPKATIGLISTRNDSIVKDQSGLLFTKLEQGNGLKVSDLSGKSKFFPSIPLLQNNSRNSNTVNSIAVDKNNTIYVATIGGIVAINADPKLLENNNLADFISTPTIGGQRTLANETVLSIAVDGGNRKWIGTKDALYLFNEDLSEIIQKFTDVNSPLPSNYVYFLNYEPISGELFVYTQNGIVSYRTSATGSDDVQEGNVLVFPNPVRPEYSGVVGVSGLVNNAFVKITDVTGRLVFQTRANGGTAVWDLNSQNGTRAEAGIYFIFSGNEFGSENFVAKLALIK